MTGLSVVFLGCGRSGTTLIRTIFDSHPSLAVSHEAHFIAPLARGRSRYMSSGSFDRDLFVRDLYSNSNFRRQGIEVANLRARLELVRPTSFPDAARSVFALYADKHQKQLYGDKTPGYVNHIPLLASLFPEAKFVHMIRDGRAVALSYLERPEWGPRTISQAAFHWRARVSRGREGGETLGPRRYMELRYEDLVNDPEKHVSLVCDFLDLDFDPAMLDFHQKASAFVESTKNPGAFQNLTQPVTAGKRDWKKELSNDEAALFEAIAGSLLHELDYEVGHASTSLRTRAQVLAAGLSWQGKRLSSLVKRSSAYPNRLSKLGPARDQ